MEVEKLTADEVRAQMQEIRCDLPVNVHGIVVNAGQMFDWKNYVRSFPWLAIGGAALAGYLLVPRRQLNVIPQQTQDALEKLSDRIEVIVAPPAAKRQASLGQTILPLIGGVALRLGTAYLTRIGNDWLNRTARQQANRSEATARGNTPPASSRTRPNYPR